MRPALQLCARLTALAIMAPVARDKAVRSRILELGPEGQTLRTTLMVPK